MAGLKWYIMTDDNTYYCGIEDGKYKTSDDEDNTLIFTNKEEVYKTVEEVKKVHPDAQVYIICWA